jgi:uncharacterized membrane protein
MKASQDDEIRTAFYDEYIPEVDVFSAQWLSWARSGGTRIFADRTSSTKMLRAYGNVEYSEDDMARYTLENNTVVTNNTYVYLRYLNASAERRLLLRR